MKRKRKERYRLWTAVAVLYAVVLPVSGLMGMTENRQNARMQSESVREVEPVNKQGAVKENEENPTGSETVFGELSLTAEQLDAAEAVFSSLESLDLEQAARLMDREQDVLADLFYETMGGNTVSVHTIRLYCSDRGRRNGIYHAGNGILWLF